MNPDERKMLTGFLDRLERAPAAPEDPEAAALIRQALARDPGLAYRLVQTAIVHEQGWLRDLAAGPAQADGTIPPTERFAGQVPRVPPPSAAEAEARARTGGDPGFLGSAMRTALGVAGGMALFSGLQSLLDSGGAAAGEAHGEDDFANDDFGGDEFGGGLDF